MDGQITAFDKNINAITEYKPYMLNLIEELDKEDYSYEGVITDIFFDKDGEGKQIVGIQKNGRDYYLNSRYSSDTAVKRWITGFHGDKIYGTAVIIGMSNLQYVRELRKMYPEVRFLIYEPDKYIWGEILIKTDISDVIADCMANIVVGAIGELYLKELLERTVDYANYKHMQMMVSPNYDKIYPESCKKVKDIVLQRVETIMVDRNTKYRYNVHYTANRCADLYDSLRQYSARDIKEVLDGLDLEKIPAILVSAGPSLDKNIRLLKEVKGKAFIVSVDTAIRALVREDIIPDMTVTIDPCKWIDVIYQDERIKETPLLMAFDSNRSTSYNHTGRKFYFYSEFRFANELWEKYNKSYIKLESGGSVANDAFSFIRKMGFKNIILIGQDLAYTGDKIHAENSFGKLLNNSVEAKGEVYIIKDINGEDIKTDYAMDIYRRWFEDQITLHKGMHVIDATEGGARIEGTEILTLREAIDKYCGNSVHVDFGELIEKVPKAYTKEERLEIESYIKNIVQEMKGSVKQKLSQAKRVYQKLEELNIKRKYSGSAFATVIEKVTEVNEWMTITTEIDMLSMYTDKENYDVMENIFEHTDDQYENIKNIASSGLKMVDAYYKATDMFVEQMEAAIDYFEGRREKPWKC